MALTMPAGDQRARIRLMRGLIQGFNAYRWVGRMLIDAAGMRRHGRLLERAATPVPSGGARHSGAYQAGRRK